MHSFRNIRAHKHISGLTDGYVASKDTTTYHHTVQRILASEKQVPIVVHGPRHSGKHAFLMAVLRSYPHHVVCADTSEILDNNQTVDVAVLNKMSRSACSASFREQTKIVEGEVVGITPDKLHLKTTDMESSFDIGVRMRDEIKKERVCSGDIVRIYKECGFVNKIGKANSIHSGILPTVPIPEGECIKTEEIESELSLDEIDTINSDHGIDHLYTDACISENIQSETNKKILRLQKEGKAHFQRGVFILNGAELLSDNAVATVLAHAKRPLSPFFILVSECIPTWSPRGEIRVSIHPPSSEAITSILRSRAKHMSLSLAGDALNMLTTIAEKTGLTTALLLMQSSALETASISALASLFGLL